MHVLVAGAEGVAVAEDDLVLTGVALALGRLDVQAGAGHAVADGAQQRLHPRGPDHGVVDVVLVGGLQVRVARGPRLLEGVAEDDELQLGPGVRRRARARPAGRAGRAAPGGARRRRGSRPPRARRTAPSPCPPATAAGAAWTGRAAGRSRRSRPTTTTSRSRRPCSSRRRRRAGSCTPRCRGAGPGRGSTRRRTACPAGVPACRSWPRPRCRSSRRPPGCAAAPG